MPEIPLHIEGTIPCPHLPIPASALDSSHTRLLGRERGSTFYLAALEYAQSLWLQGFPARSLLLVNRALGADLQGDESALEEWPLPYSAAAWIMSHRLEEQFIGNPRRHYQHLATRMVEPRKELRCWRAWACWFMACRIFPDYPADQKQIAEEGVIEPDKVTISDHLHRLGTNGETNLWEQAVDLSGKGLTAD
ncbi:MAG: hypothetical protein ACI9R3_004940 [Verrucomicrobiales bacterium]|jgi:hypothetical protein